MSDSTLRGRLIRLASTYEKGSPERKRLLNVLTAEFDPNEIGELKDGPLEIVEPPSEPFMDGEYTQQEFQELGDKQESGVLNDGAADDAPMVMASEKALRDGLVRLAHAKKELRPHLLPLISAYDKAAGCEKLPEGPMRDNCEKKKEEGGKDDDKE